MMGLADEIAAADPNSFRRRTWFDNLPAEAADELLAVRQRFRDGGYELKPLQIAKLLYERCQARGWKTCDPTRLSQWLQQND
jgi:hypothetical protein